MTGSLGQSFCKRSGLPGTSPNLLEKDQGATRLGATGPRVSERKICLRKRLREDLRKPPRGSLCDLLFITSVFLGGFRRPSRIPFCDLLLFFTSVPLGGFRRPSWRPSRRRIFLSETLGPVAPNRVAPWSFSKRFPEAHRRLPGCEGRAPEYCCRELVL